MLTLRLRGYDRQEVDAFLARCLASGVSPALHPHLSQLTPTGAFVSAADVAEVRFATRLRGYDQNEVDDLLDRVASALE